MDSDDSWDSDTTLRLIHREGFSRAIGFKYHYESAVGFVDVLVVRDTIVLRKVEIFQQYRGRGLCTPMVTEALAQTLEHGEKPRTGTVEVESATPERAISCYIAAFAAAGYYLREHSSTSPQEHLLEFTAA